MPTSSSLRARSRGLKRAMELGRTSSPGLATFFPRSCAYRNTSITMSRACTAVAGAPANDLVAQGPQLVLGHLLELQPAERPLHVSFVHRAAHVACGLGHLVLGEPFLGPLAEAVRFLA